MLSQVGGDPLGLGNHLAQPVAGFDAFAIASRQIPGCTL